MTKLVKFTAAAGALSFAAALPAHAHEGDHSAPVLANIMHWLSSPTHALFALIGGVAVSALIIKLARKSRA